MEPETLQQYFSLLSPEGITLDQIKIKSPLSLTNYKVSLDKMSFYDFVNKNEKWIEKVKLEAPTVVKFNQVKIVGKEKFYFHFLKQLCEAEGEGLWRRVLRALK